MKTQKQTSSKDQKSIKGKQTEAAKKKGASTTDTTTPATATKKAKAGAGLANEGTITSYDEERV